MKSKPREGSEKNTVDVPNEVRYQGGTRPIGPKHRIERGQQHTLNVSVSPDKRVLNISATLPDDTEAFKTALIERLTELGVSKHVLALDVDRWLAQAGAPGTVLTDAILYTCNEPRPPSDAAIAWGGPFFDEGFEVDPETGAIDFRQKAAQNEVVEGQLLATISPAEPGESGENVFGEIMQPPQPETVKIKAGANVRQEGDFEFYAEIAGRVAWNGETLKVDNVLRFAEGVGLKTGHVNHNGAVVVEGDVLTGSKISATGDISITGIIEGADVRADGNLTVRGGIVGAEGAHVSASGKILAKYILDANVTCGGDVIIEKEIVNSEVEADGAVSVANGRIVGGRIRTFGGVRCARTGSEAGVRTTIIVACDPKTEDIRNNHLAKLKNLSQQRQSTIEKVVPFKNILANLPPDKVAVVKKLAQQLQAIDDAIAQHKQTLDALDRTFETDRQIMVKVRETIYNETRFNLFGENLKVEHTIVGPAKVRLLDGKVVISTR